MSKRVLFNGAVLVRPGAATKIDASQFENVSLAGLGTVALLGSADGGLPRTVQVFNSSTGVKTEYGAGNLVEAAAMAADPSNDPRITAGAQVLVCYKTNNSTQSSLTEAAHLLKSKAYGLRANSIQLTTAAAAPTISSVSTTVAPNTLNDTVQAMTPSAYVGYWLTDSAGAVFKVVDNGATSFTLAAGGATPAAGAYTLMQYHPYGRLLTVTALDADGVLVTDTSVLLGSTGKFTIQYTGAGTKCVITVNSTSIAAVCTGAAGDNFTFLFADYPTLDVLVRAIDSLATFTATALITSAPSFPTTSLDAVVVPDVKTIVTSIMATNFDIGDWINANSFFITDTVTAGAVGLMPIVTAVGFTGGTAGSADNTAWTNGYTALAGLRCNQVVPLASQDGSIEGGGTYTFSSILAAAVAHAKLLSSTKGRSERQSWVGMHGTKSALITAANAQNSEHLCLLGQKVMRNRTSDGAMTTFAEWALAVICAGLRAGAPLGEPLTWKYINCQGVVDDPSWSSSNTDDVVDMILNGVMTVCAIQGKGWRIEKGITTYTRTDNDAYTEETIVQIWKMVGYELRTLLEDRYTGRPGTLDMVKTVPATCISLLELYRSAGAISDSLIAGVVLKAYRNIAVSLSGDIMTVGVTISPTPGINFILNTIVLVPVRISL